MEKDLDSWTKREGRRSFSIKGNTGSFLGSVTVVEKSPIYAVTYDKRLPFTF